MDTGALQIGARVRLQYGGKPYGPVGLVVDIDHEHGTGLGVVAFRSAGGAVTEICMPPAALYVAPRS